MIDKECGGDASRLAGPPWVATEVLEGYLSSQLDSLRRVGSKPLVWLPSVQHQSLKSTQITSSCEKWQDFSQPEMDGWRCKEPFKGPRYKFSYAATYPGLQQSGGQSGLEMLEVRLGTVALGRGLREQLP